MKADFNVQGSKLFRRMFCVCRRTSSPKSDIIMQVISCFQRESNDTSSMRCALASSFLLSALQQPIHHGTKSIFAPSASIIAFWYLPTKLESHYNLCPNLLRSMGNVQKSLVLMDAFPQCDHVRCMTIDMWAVYRRSCFRVWIRLYGTMTQNA